MIFQKREKWKNENGGRPFKINKDFVADFGKTDLPKIIKELRKPILDEFI